VYRVEKSTGLMLVQDEKDLDCMYSLWILRIVLLVFGSVDLCCQLAAKFYTVLIVLRISNTEWMFELNGDIQLTYV
jgi:hypothetical protein